MTNIGDIIVRMGASVGKNKKALISESQIKKYSLFHNPRLDDLITICNITDCQLIIKLRSGVEIPIVEQRGATFR